MNTFRVIGGLHIHGKNPDGSQKVYQKGDLIETELDLVTMFGDKKFQLVDPGTVVSKEPVPAQDEAAELSGLTIQELKEYAEAEEIDLGNATKKEDIIKAIVATR